MGLASTEAERGGLGDFCAEVVLAVLPVLPVLVVEEVRGMGAWSVAGKRGMARSGSRSRSKGKRGVAAGKRGWGRGGRVTRVSMAKGPWRVGVLVRPRARWTGCVSSGGP